jgi:hypothetical protein
MAEVQACQRLTIELIFIEPMLGGVSHQVSGHASLAITVPSPHQRRILC